MLEQHSIPAAAPGRTVFPEAPAAQAAPPVAQQQLPSAVLSPWGPDGRLTRTGMERVIAGGGSVLHPDHPVLVINDIKKLPSAATLARTPEERDAARNTLIDKRRELERQLDEIDVADEKAWKEKNAAQRAVIEKAAAERAAADRAASEAAAREKAAETERVAAETAAREKVASASAAADAAAAAEAEAAKAKAAEKPAKK
jgi:hypothetical protein